MRIPVLLSLAALAFALGPVACSSSEADDAVVTPDGEEGSAEDELRSLTLTEADANKTITVTEGQNVVVKLQSNPTTGFKWVVAATDRTFGYPYYERFIKNGDAVGSGGVQRMTWKTKGGLSMVGEHRVTLEYKREWETNVAPAKTFTFTIKIVSGQCPELSPPAPGFCQNGQIKAKKDDRGCTTGFECVQDCRATSCGAGKYCSFCWGSFACIPNGAMC